MGVLKHSSSGKSIVLPAHAVAGRAPGSAVRLSGQGASNDHASISWTGSRWEARDLGSTNGTFVDDSRIPLKENAPLAKGSVIRFGSKDEVWELTDDRGPVLLAR
jgi:pSer/pThr/pTyr-binding forkhead associated (FHA) protein